ncbi:hypothetical protein F3Y22_tig00117011pilonHSYRG00098 [Hibiscus syriacus]|uniref:J domain-containing protein n=1 Tax=Hibiscus syriacus TaxID=106335 RepID=A0A6A2WCS7_HIBSY|nr:chaperone protein dnaJ 11, chloroplastic-like [Hibiscus syriacus]KAE8656073.1 hypothetical protein F3Y22_tig00117011pilonHSYRG00098 [Hibiscus syriacus]
MASFTSSSAHFLCSKVSIKEQAFMPTRVHFRQLRISAACSSTAERPVSHIACPSSLYEVLGIPIGATCDEIKAAYRRLARVLHPDVSANGRKAAAANEFIKVHEAYSTLSDPEKRADYDRTLLFRSRQSFSLSVEPMTGSTSSQSSGYTKRTWETDQCW